MTFTDPVQGRYAKLVVTDDAATLLGGILVGDAAPYATLRAVGRPAACRRSRDIARSGWRRCRGGAGSRPADAQICSCHGVNKDAICSAITESAR